MKNADFTEGRGPMLFHSVYDTFEAAEYFILNQDGIYGSKQGPSGYGDNEKRKSYNGYEILIDDLQSFSDVELELDNKKKIADIEFQLEKLKMVKTSYDKHFKTGGMWG